MTIKEDIMKALHALHNLNFSNLHLLNDATLILLPRRKDAVTPKDFRPINLISSFAKLFTKILAMRLRDRMKEIVPSCQNAFIRGTIHDNYAHVDGLAKAFRQSKNPTIMVKFDTKKAFDTISWEFLLQVLEAKGFGRKVRD